MRLAKAVRTGGYLLPVLALAAVLALSGCGGSGDSSDTAATGSVEAGKEKSSAENGKGPERKQSSGARNGSGSSAPQSEGEPESGGTSQRQSTATTANITLESPAFKSGAVLPVTYTCDGEEESPPLQWSGLPEDAAELVLLGLNAQPVDEALFFNWAVAGLDPSLEEIEAGELPSGVVVGKNSSGKEGYSLCPPEKGETETYYFMLYAIPEVLDPDPGFDPLQLREEVLGQSGNVGLISASYTHP